MTSGPKLSVELYLESTAGTPPLLYCEDGDIYFYEDASTEAPLDVWPGEPIEGWILYG